MSEGEAVVQEIVAAGSVAGMALRAKSEKMLTQLPSVTLRLRKKRVTCSSRMGNEQHAVKYFFGLVSPSWTELRGVLHAHLKGLVMRILMVLLIALQPAMSDAAIPTAERDELMALFSATGGQHWNANYNWCSGNGGCTGTITFNSPGTECTWYGITCDSTSTHVVGLKFQENNLIGALVPLSNLTNLQTVEITINPGLTGQIPDLSTLSNLTTATFSDNAFTGELPPLPNGNNFISFDASDNALTGAISSLPLSVTEYGVGGNKLSGQLPSLENNIALEGFSASNNVLTGSLPDLSALKNLRGFAVNGNQLIGSIPTSLGNLTALEDYEVDNNQLTGAIPNISGMTSLIYFTASHNQLTGPIPAISSINSIDTLDVSHNQLTGYMPDITHSPTLESVDVSFNQLSGNLPSLEGLYLSFFYANDNLFTGSVPSLGTSSIDLYYNVSNNLLDGSLPGSVSTNSGIRIFDASNNRLTGHLPSLQGLMRLVEFDVHTNRLTGSIPPFVPPELDNMFMYDVSDNLLSGNIPALTTNVPDLGILRVGHNLLTGPVPVATYYASVLDAGRSSLCPNLLTTTASANDAGWNEATGFSPWWATPNANNICDEIFIDGFEG